ncbi:hypothetical protein AVEN_88114-1 [Araneus ventricosus]|uniref:Tc1-like transposase DDE domain-containing protein n=1 Tax=Araneus ventricosus TaxID=182803 RepID=A0A4Y2VJ92_ARAVE|nr:hypothetical protein AVEN_88114-1 [Araneus ventricosus]
MHIERLDKTAVRGLLDVIPASKRAEIFQQDGANAHTSTAVRDFLNEQYPRWIGRRGPIPCPPRSPDLAPMDFFVWGSLKQDVYCREVASLGRRRLKARSTSRAPGALK